MAGKTFILRQVNHPLTCINEIALRRGSAATIGTHLFNGCWVTVAIIRIIGGIGSSITGNFLLTQQRYIGRRVGLRGKRT